MNNCKEDEEILSLSLSLHAEVKPPPPFPTSAKYLSLQNPL